MSKWTDHCHKRWENYNYSCYCLIIIWSPDKNYMLKFSVFISKKFQFLISVYMPDNQVSVRTAHLENYTSTMIILLHGKFITFYITIKFYWFITATWRPLFQCGFDKKRDIQSFKTNSLEDINKHPPWTNNFICELILNEILN